MIREIIRPQRDRYTVQIPREYIGNEVEILILPFSSENHTKVYTGAKKSLAGALKHYANPALIEKEKEIAWDEITKDYDALP